MTDNIQNAYTTLADCYDALMQGADYPAWADRITDILASNNIYPGALVCELGCGTGSMTLELLRRGWDMTALDLSGDMLTAARRKLDSSGIDGASEVLLLQQDMRSFELYGSVAAVVCVLDGINYLTEVRDIRACFKWVKNYLDPGGVFVFDVNTPHKFKDVFGQSDMILEADGVYCGWQNTYDPETRLCEFDLTIFKRDGDGLWTRSEEKQYEKCWGMKSLTRNLELAGLCDIRFYSGYSDRPACGDDDRWVVTARRPNC